MVLNNIFNRLSNRNSNIICNLKISFKKLIERNFRNTPENNDH